MALTTHIITIKDYEDVDPNDFLVAMLAELKQTQIKIDSLIEMVANGDANEIERICRAFRNMVLKHAVVDEIPTDHFGISFFSADDKEPTLIEGFLSGAYVSCDACLYDLRDRDFSEAFASFANANYFFGMADGSRKVSDLNDLKKRFIQVKASASRHAENRAIKDEVIQEYEDNYVPRLKGLGVREASKIKNKAAEELANKYEVEYRTVRHDYIDKYHRENTPS